MKNVYKIINGVIYIQLTQCKIALVDESDFPKIKKYTWHAARDHKRENWYVRTSIAIPNINGQRQRILPIHRLLMNLDFGDIRQVDHLDGNGLNNCRNNLRTGDRYTNMHNQHGKKPYEYGRIPTSKYPGVCWDDKNQKWVTRIANHRIYIHLGYFNSESDAAKAYQQAKIIRDTGGTNDEIKAAGRNATGRQ